MTDGGEGDWNVPCKDEDTCENPLPTDRHPETRQTDNHAGVSLDDRHLPDRIGKSGRLTEVGRGERSYLPYLPPCAGPLADRNRMEDKGDRCTRIDWAGPDSR